MTNINNTKYQKLDHPSCFIHALNAFVLGVFCFLTGDLANPSRPVELGILETNRPQSGKFPFYLRYSFQGKNLRNYLLSKEISFGEWQTYSVMNW